MENCLAERSYDRFFTVLPSPEGSVQVRHQALLSFVRDEGRRLEIDTNTHVEASRARMAKCYLDYLNLSLKHNVIEANSVGKLQLSDISDHQHSLLSPSLQDACKEWSPQLLISFDNTNTNSAIPLSSLVTFLETHLLHWIEVLVLCDSLDIAAPSLKRAEEWLRVSRHMCFLRA